MSYMSKEKIYINEEKKKPCHMWCTPKNHNLISIPYLNLYI